MIRKVKLVVQSFGTWHLLQSYKSLSGGRFKFGHDFVAGKGFNIQTDLTSPNIRIGDAFRARRQFQIVTGHNAGLIIGNHCFFNNGCSVNCLGKITIGNDCQFGENVLMYDHNHKHDHVDKPIGEQGYNIGTISIGDNCWIGSNVVILKDVHIGNNVVIGAGCVIHKSIAPGSIVYHQQDLRINERQASGTSSNRKQ